MERQALNVFRMKLMGAEVRPVYSGTATLKDATSEAIRDWVSLLSRNNHHLTSNSNDQGPPFGSLGQVRLSEFDRGTGKMTLPCTCTSWPPIIV